MNNSQKDMTKRNMCTIIVAGFLFAGMLMMPQLKDGRSNVPPENQVWMLDSVPKNNVRYGQCDATDTCLYFTYTGVGSRVDVFDHNGSFLYAFVFEDANNGRTYIRCVGDDLYIKLRNDNVFVFRGKETVSKLSEDEANSLGFTNEWFKNGVSNLFVSEGHLYYRGSNQHESVQVVTPSQVKLPTEIIDFGSETNGLIVGLCAALLLIYMGHQILRGKD